MCRKPRPLIWLVVFGCLLWSSSALVPGATFTVSTVADTGGGSLRQAMTSANVTPGPDIIRFNLSGTGVQIIAPRTELPTITESVLIDGTTQAGYQGVPLIQLAGSNTVEAAGLRIHAAHCTVRGLIIGQFAEAGIRLETSGGNLIVGNYLGTDSSLATDLANGYGIFIGTNCSLNTIGGTDVASRNLVAGNRRSGIFVAAGASDNVIQGNWIGLAGSGELALANLGGGVTLSNSVRTTLGGTEAGARNIISGNTGNGISIQGRSTEGDVIQGNVIGLSALGRLPLPNSRNGIEVTDANRETIGGTEPGAGNVISGNGAAGIRCHGTAHVIQSNRIGTDADGRAAVPNGLADRAAGIVADGSEHTIGGSADGRNIVSGNMGYGILLLGSNMVVQANFVGLDVSGTNALANQQAGVAVLSLAFNNLIGGAEPDQGNVISGNHGSGILLAGQSRETAVVGNRIGTEAAGGAAAAPNDGDGIRIEEAARDNVVGGATAAAGNQIAFNGRSGVGVAGPDATGNTITGNRISGHAILGIRLQRPNDPTGAPAINDPLDADAGPNGLQNYPIITNIVAVDDLTVVQGTLRSVPSRDYAIDVYDNAVAGRSGYGEGEAYSGSIVVTTDEQGEAGFAFINSGFFPGRWFTSTATDLDTGSTSEFGPAFLNSSAVPALSIPDITVPLGRNAAGIAAFSVTLSTPTFRTVRVNYSTAPGTAAAGADFVATNGVLTIVPGEKSGSIPIVLLPRAAAQPDKTFFVNLANPENSTITDGQGQATLVDFVITGVTRTGAATAIHCTTSSAHLYRLERSVVLGPYANWLPVDAAVNVPGTGGIVTLTDTNVAGTGFYRVQRSP